MTEQETKKEMVRLILTLYPEWVPGVEAVQLDRDGEVRTHPAIRSMEQGAGAPHAATLSSTGIGWVFEQPLYGELQAQGIPHFWSKSGYSVAGYAFDRFEYEVYRAAILQEQEAPDEQETD